MKRLFLLPLVLALAAMPVQVQGRSASHPRWSLTVEHLDYATMRHVVRVERHSYPLLRSTSHPVGHTTRVIHQSPHIVEKVVYPIFTPAYALPGCPWAIARWASSIVPAARSVGLSNRALTGVIAIESGGNPSATNPVSGAAGLMQLLPSTAFALGANPYDPTQAIPAGARYLAEVGPVFYSGGGYGWDMIYARSCD